MPAGMLLKSEGFASNLYDRAGHFTLKRFCTGNALPYGAIGLPVPLETFTAYGLAFQRELVPNVNDKVVVGLDRLTEAFFERVSFVGMGSIEFKRDSRTGQFLMIEPTVGRIDGQEEVATLHGANIPLAAYLHEIGLPGLHVGEDSARVIWRNFFLALHVSKRRSLAAEA